MFCRKCGTPIENGAKFCNKCGAPVAQDNNQSAFQPPVTNRPQVNNQQPIQPPVANRPQVNNQQPIQPPVVNRPQMNNQKTFGQPKKEKKGSKTAPIIAIASIVVVFIVSLILIIGLSGRKPKNSNNYNSASVNSGLVDEYGINVEDYKEDLIDAEQFLSQKGQIISKTQANQSNTVQSASAAFNDFAGRGFSFDTLAVYYDMNGNLTEEEITSSDSGNYPMYAANYVTPSGQVWQLMSINGSVMAYPLSYNLNENTSDTAVVFSEKNSIISYDSASNTFYEVVPNASEANVKVVGRIDKNTLDTMQIGG